LGGSGRCAARTRAPATITAPAATIAANMPHAMPTVAARSETSGLSNSRQISSSSAQPPANVIATPSPPGRWKPFCCERAQTRKSTASATSNTAASTNVKTCSADRLSVTKRPCWTSKNDFSYHGSTIVNASAAAAMPARRISGASLRSAVSGASLT
jgi:hypothetical protein